MHKLDDFLKWMRTNNFFISSKISITTSQLSNYGLIAIDHIAKGEILFKIPRESLLSTKNSPLYDKLLSENLIKKSKWACLILCIFHEVFLADKSKWKIYLDLFPNFDNLKLPMFWNNEEMTLLNHTNLLSAIEQDTTNIDRDYQEIIIPFIRKYPEYFNGNISKDLYKSLVAFVMAYSFTESIENDDENEQGMTSMVPMADVLNHTSINNAQLMFEQELVMVATKSIEKGQEIFNTYGELSNNQLLHMYGFTLPYDDNKDDFVELTLIDLNESDRLPSTCFSRIKSLKEIAPELLSVIVGKTGFLNTEELAMIIHALTMSDGDFQVFCEDLLSDDSWQEENEEVNLLADQLDSFETAKTIALKYKNILNLLVSKQYEIKKKALENLTRQDNNSDLPSPKLFVITLLSGHVQILENYLRIIQ